MRLKQNDLDTATVVALSRIDRTYLNTAFDVPGTVGISEDWNTVYIDRCFPREIGGTSIVKTLMTRAIVARVTDDEDAVRRAEESRLVSAGVDSREYRKRMEDCSRRLEEMDRFPSDLYEGLLDMYTRQFIAESRRTEKKQSVKTTLKKVLTTEKISLEYHDVLNPTLWESGTNELKANVALKLIEIAEAWAQFARIPMSSVTDIVVTGGNANYNYTPQSDIDLHLIIDRNTLGTDRALIDDYLAEKKSMWALTRDIRIHGYPVELYAQDVHEKHPDNQGVYSLVKKKWLYFPKHGSYDFSDDEALQRKVNFYEGLIDDMIKNSMSPPVFYQLKNKLREMRASGIAKAGDLAFENLVFKELRNNGYLDKMNKYEKALRDQELSLQ